MFGLFNLYRIIRKLHDQILYRYFVMNALPGSSWENRDKTTFRCYSGRSLKLPEISRAADNMMFLPRTVSLREADLEIKLFGSIQKVCVSQHWLVSLSSKLMETQLLILVSTKCP